MRTIVKASALLPLILAGSLLASSAQDMPPLIPAPAHAVHGDGVLKLTPPLVFEERTADSDATAVVGQLRHLLATTHDAGVLAGAGAGDRKAPRLVFEHRAPHPHPGDGPDESYALTIAPSGVRIAASSRAGYFYGAVSLWQLLSQSHGTLAAWKIEDEPRFRWRGIMLDSARHMQSETLLLQLIDFMAAHKLNMLHWHLTDDQGWRIEIKQYPRLTSVGGYRPQTMPPYHAGTSAPTGPYGGFYTQQQIRRIVAYAAERNVTIVPEIEMPGHATAPLVAYPEFGSTDAPLRSMPVGWGIYPNLYAPTDATFTFLENVLSEVMDLFPSPYIHVGGDEAIKNQWKASPAVQAKIHQLGLKDEDALQSWFMARIETYINSKGRRMVGWDEILQGGLSKHATVMSWRGVEGGISAARQGHDAILTPNRPLYFNYRQSGATDEPAGRDPINSLADVYNFKADLAGLSTEEQSHIIGVQGSIWSEYVITDDRMQHMLFPRAAALAELGWSPAQEKDFTGFLHRLPADQQRAEDAGVRPAWSIFEVQVHATPTSAQTANVTLSTQGGLGAIHYTTDGAAVTAAAPVYTQPLQLPLPTTVQALAFDGTTALGKAVTQQVTLQSSVRRDSRELDACNAAAGIQMEQDPPRNEQRPVFRVVFSHPCWIYRDADLAQFKSVTLDVASIPYIFHSQGKPLPQPSDAATTDADIAVHADKCDGPLLTRIPLQPAWKQDGITSLPAATLPPMSGRHDLCFEVEKNDPATVWLLHSIQPMPN